MANKTASLVAGAFVALALLSFPAAAKLTPEEAAALGADLTPVGAEKAANADGSIPAWDGGIKAPPAGYSPGDHHPDPFASDAVLFTITGANMSQYAGKLTPGHQAMLQTYDTFKMKVYPTRRSAAYPQRIYDATKRIATTAELAEGGNGIRGALMGVPFPMPKVGVEVIWNHLTRYRGDIASRKIAQAAPTRSGDYTPVVFEDEFNVVYSQEGQTEESLNNRILYFKQEVVAPARLAGGILLVHETLDQVKEPRAAWLYNPGQRRVRRAPNVAYDNPGTAADGMRTSDQFDMFNGAPDRYDWTLVGKKEIYVPYNNYQLHSDQLKHADILTPLHINPEYLRYELHRVWVVDATLKAGTSHVYKRRTLYVDEDSWQVLLVDQYDNRDQLWRVSEGFVINYYDVPMLWTTLEVHTDLQAGRYLAIGLDNEYPMYNFDIERTLDDYTPAALRREGIR
ncbi:MAG: DUF1329 domain-containing protein [Acidobacteriota bacterium]|nr:DUF1329 domain-containing protein [Acidobacteriota bacterium]MDH3523279.1 DUF1329 domain-containing protein [Acidobacteriota bacterium]